MNSTPVKTKFADGWNHFWFRPAAPLGPIAVRALIAANALWIVLSRPNLPALSGWPREFWESALPYRAIRFLFIPGFPDVERILYGVLHLTLIAAIFGVQPRFACIVSAVLLYHFAPFEEIILHSRGPALRGLTFPVLGLFVMGMAQTPRKLYEAWSEEFRWPVTLFQALFCFQYISPGLHKLNAAGLAWALPDSIRRSIIWADSAYAEPLPWARAIVDSPALCGVIALVTLATELLFPLVLFSRTAARIIVPIVLIGHLGIPKALGFAFVNLPLLLIYLDWDGIARRMALRPAESERPDAIMGATDGIST